eukprot:TRINITY_DN7380_c0_g3_i1.p1 TRINITY_DN7380_c0_g3~~TRINITY_DN7380_c0_g3_i1.p1  ORF type:complete len:155 (+),score=29.05 TRINITY_DN7380_c0_g3_i1:174-638(+)
MVLTPKEAKMVSDSWAVLNKDLEKHAVVLFQEFFKWAPDVKEMFSDAEVKTEKSRIRWRRHKISVLRLVGNAAASLADKEEAEHWHGVFFDLGVRHAKFNVLTDQLPLFGEALLATVEKGVGFGFSGEMRAAWKKAYAAISEPMHEGLREGLAE